MKIVAAIVLAVIILKLLDEATDTLFARGKSRQSILTMMMGFGLIVGVVIACVLVLVF